MPNYNRFGTTYDKVVALYPKTVAADYDPAITSPASAGGQAEIERTMDRVSRLVASALTPDVFTQMTQVHAEEVVRLALANQSTATLGMVPARANTVHLWVYPSLLAMNASSFGGVIDGGAYADLYWKEPQFGLGELDSSQFAVNVTTGAITAISPTLTVGQRLYASYETDTEDATFSIPSLADVVIIGAAAELGERLYTESTQKWDLVKTYKEQYDALLAALREGTLVPDELRRLNYWTEIERSSKQWGGIRLDRG